MTIEFLGHACFELGDGKHTLLVDPYLTGNPLASKSADQVNPDFVFVTHAHDDHLGDAVAIARRTGAVLCGVVGLVEGMLGGEGLKTAPGNLGGRQKTPFGSVKFAPALHGSGIPGDLACGFVFELGGRKIYHAGDTALTMDLALLKDEELDVALLPIGGRFTMDPADAARAAELIGAKTVVPMHYNTTPLLRQDPREFQRLVETRCRSRVVLLNPGEKLNV